MIYLLKRDDSFTVFYEFEAIPKRLQSEVIEVESLPDGEGILRMSEDGKLYYEPFLEPEPIESKPTLEESQNQILLETQYQTVLLELLSGF